MRLSIEQRHLLVDAVSRGVNKTTVAQVFAVSRQTVHYWWGRYREDKRRLLKDKPRKKRRKKITQNVEFAILAMRYSFEWGTARIQQGLINLPPFMKAVLSNTVQNVQLSRTSINDVLKKHNMNGYARKQKQWKFFRAKKTDELWQIDLKGPVHMFGEKYYFLVVVDDFSRYLLVYHCMTACPTTEDITNILSHVARIRTPKKILADNGPQFREEWEEWCKEYQIIPLFAHAYYPQDKGKVERAIRNVSEEHVKLMRKYPEWMNKLDSYRRWYNTKRYHRGIQATPIQLQVGVKLET